MSAIEAPADTALASRDAEALVSLFEGPYVIQKGHLYAVPGASQRLLAFVGLRGRRLNRRAAARALWPDTDDEHASRNLRTALWRLRHAGINAIVADQTVVRLRDRVDVDVTLACERSARLIDDVATEADLRGQWPRPDQFDLLPDWDDDWVIFERERVRQRLLHGLEALSRRLLDAGREAEAVEPAMLAVTADPLRESAQLALVRAHLGEGNIVEARRAYDAYRLLLGRELGAKPGPTMTRLVSLQCPTQRPGYDGPT